MVASPLIDPSRLLIRASQMGGIMPSENAKVPFTDTQIDHLIEAFNSFFYERYEEINSKYFTKGSEREEDAITLLSLVTRKAYKKNTKRKNNAFVTGEWDLQDEENGKIIETVDTKNAWSKNTFDKSRVKKLNIFYFYQGHVYMWLTGAIRHTVAYCLVNNTHKYMRDHVRSIGWKMGILDGDVSQDPEYIKKIQQLERNNIFDIDAFMKDVDNQDYMPKSEYQFKNGVFTWAYDIPAAHRVYRITFERDENIIKRMEARVIQSRAWIYNNLVLTLKNK